ncbi:hypothetical protein [Methylobacterium nonmethylotrophicum]|uniref:Uncharacterized protein n=1 Tax=Methylobacterium nonmethylotrophicum TaxID=1141884 RepID=A0A4Z0NIJ2_9HYPH|nr:hypothetical protein [Methylobacterium nonmethylotrophicum]TGD96124.1 hypothetical protein EU555_24475 [Methylobacterium nonmethylotrophicum]
MYTYLTRVPSSTRGETFTLGVHEITLASNLNRGLLRRWHNNVQAEIKRHYSTRPDTNWNWQRNIMPLILLGMGHRGGRLFQVTVGTDERPAAMIALLSRERWCLDAGKSATFVFFLSAAPDSCRGPVVT